MNRHANDDAPIASLRNLGLASAGWLGEIGVNTIGDLARLGPALAYRLVKERRPRVSRNLLWAMAAGLENRDWRDLSEEEKTKLRAEAECE